MVRAGVWIVVGSLGSVGCGGTCYGSDCEVSGTPIVEWEYFETTIRLEGGDKDSFEPDTLEVRGVSCEEGTVMWKVDQLDIPDVWYGRVPRGAREQVEAEALEDGKWYEVTYSKPLLFTDQVITWVPAYFAAYVAGSSTLETPCSGELPALSGGDE